MPDSIICASDGHDRSSWINLQRVGWPIAAILCAVGLWGGSFAAMRFVLQTLNPWSVMWLRMVIPMVLLLPLAGRLKHFQYRCGDWKLLIPMVLFQPCLYFLLESNALRMTTSSQAGVIAAFVPLMVTIGAYLLLAEPVNRRSIWGLAFSMAGVAGLTLMQGDRSQAANPILGNILELCAMGCAAANMLVIKKLSMRYNAWTLTALQVAAGAVFFLPGLWFLIQDRAILFTPDLIRTILFLSIFVTLGAFGLYNWGMSRIPAGKASVFINLVPVIALAIGWLVMGEVLTAAQWMAALAVMGGVWVTQSA
jgi:drug/metabolite transporter (DMT)-like permease